MRAVSQLGQALDVQQPHETSAHGDFILLDHHRYSHKISQHCLLAAQLQTEQLSRQTYVVVTGKPDIVYARLCSEPQPWCFTTVVAAGYSHGFLQSLQILPDPLLTPLRHQVQIGLGWALNISASSLQWTVHCNGLAMMPQVHTIYSL